MYDFTILLAMTIHPRNNCLPEHSPSGKQTCPVPQDPCSLPFPGLSWFIAHSV